MTIVTMFSWFIFALSTIRRIGFGVSIYKTLRSGRNALKQPVLPVLGRTNMCKANLKLNLRASPLLGSVDGRVKL